MQVKVAHSWLTVTPPWTVQSIEFFRSLSLMSLLVSVVLPIWKFIH